MLGDAARFRLGLRSLFVWRGARWFAALLMLLSVLSFGFVWDYVDRLGPEQSGVTVVFPRGSSLREISEVLSRAGVVRYPSVFMYVARVLRGDRFLLAGEYHFSGAITPRAVVHALMSGDTVVRKITFAEGLTSQQVVDLLSQAGGLMGDINQPVEEGSLLPDTYHYSYGDTRQSIIDRMREGMRDHLAQAWEGRSASLPFEHSYDALILASIVEKETGVASERGQVASVFINRLRKQMRLQTDPTVIYGLAPGAGGVSRPLTKQDLAVDSPYNTYKHFGLPPTPIANPGMASIHAVLHPAQTDDLYFVADGDGGHNFSRSLREHNKNVQLFRKRSNDKLHEAAQ